MGASQSYEGFDPDDRPPQPSSQSLPGYISSYFTPQPPRPLTTHSHRVSQARVAEIERLLAHKLPLELAQRVLDYAHVWASCRRECSQHITVYAGGAQPRGTRGIEWGNGQEDEVSGLEVMDSPGNVWCLASAPVGHGDGERGETANEESEHDEDRRQSAWVRALVIETFSKDQGWADDQRNYGTYNGSFSWFELSLVRDGEEVTDSRCTVQHNVVAGQYYKAHRIVLQGSHPLLRAARDGDRIVLWARAMYPGWANHVRRSAMVVYTAPYAPGPA